MIIMKKELFEQAKKNVESYKKERLDDEIKKEYDSLLYDSQKRKASKKKLNEIKKIYEVAKQTKISGLGHSYMIHGVRGSLQEIIKTGIYHPKDIIKFKKILKIK